MYGVHYTPIVPSIMYVVNGHQRIPNSVILHFGPENTRRGLAMQYIQALNIGHRSYEIISKYVGYFIRREYAMGIL